MKRKFQAAQWVIAMFVVIASANVAMARLGETYEQCVQRYGPLVEKEGDGKYPQFIFEKDGIEVGINFLNGKAAQISYKKAGFFLDADIQRLLDVDSAGSPWQFDPVETQRKLDPDVYSKQEYFKRSDGGAVAQHLALNGVEFLIITTTEYNKAISAEGMQGF
jgi:hypothetical protein